MQPAASWCVGCWTHVEHRWCAAPAVHAAQVVPGPVQAETLAPEAPWLRAGRPSSPGWFERSGDVALYLAARSSTVMVGKTAAERHGYGACNPWEQKVECTARRHPVAARRLAWPLAAWALLFWFPFSRSSFYFPHPGGGGRGVLIQSIQIQIVSTDQKYKGGRAAGSLATVSTSTRRLSLAARAGATESTERDTRPGDVHHFAQIVQISAHRSSSLQSRRARHGTSSCLPRIPKPDSETGSSAPVSSCAFPSTPSSSFIAFLAALGSFLLALPPPSVLRYCSHSLLLSSSRPSASRSGAPSRTPPSPPPPRCL